MQALRVLVAIGADRCLLNCPEKVCFGFREHSSGAEARSFADPYGTAEAVPLQNCRFSILTA
jgi:hypothetical protein